MNSHGIFLSFYAKNWLQFGPNWYQIQLLFHVIYPSLFFFHAETFPCMGFGQVQVMEFPWQLLRIWRDLHRIWSHFDQTAVKRHEKIPVTFLQGLFLFLFAFSPFFVYLFPGAGRNKSVMKVMSSFSFPFPISSFSPFTLLLF